MHLKNGAWLTPNIQKLFYFRWNSAQYLLTYHVSFRLLINQLLDYLCHFQEALTCFPHQCYRRHRICYFFFTWLIWSHVFILQSLFHHVIYSTHFLFNPMISYVPWKRFWSCLFVVTLISYTVILFFFVILLFFL